jgi:uncharacterized membrane protein (DUF106 family)
VADTPEAAAPTETAESVAAAATRPAMGKGGLQRFILIFLGMLAVLSMVDQGLSQGFAVAAGLILGPVIGFGGHFPVITILLAGMLTTSISSILRHYHMDWVKMARNQKVMAAFRKENMEVLRKGNQAKIAKMKKIQQRLMQENSQTSLNSMKPVIYTFFLFIVLFVWLRVFVDQTLGGLGNMYIAVPWAPQVYLEYVPFWLPSWILLYSLLAIPIGQVITRVLKYVSFRRKLETMGLPLRAEPEEPA